MQKILIIEDDETFISFIEELSSDYLEYVQVTIVNPKNISFEFILSYMDSNQYGYILIDHNYSELNYTGKDLVEKSNCTGKIFSISGDKKYTEYCTKYIGKLGLIEFFENFTHELSTCNA